ncbi:hypothetical protein M434DRAFT_38509 [Hypoxylon sp. CO27-5]|nr:hypothetical protein M434DRAFT_38509 [Hypoxylon sp. CO27-5]
MSQPKLFLYDHPASSYAMKVRIMLREKGVPFDKAMPDAIGSGKAMPSLAEANPRVEVPALVDGDFKIFDSKVILAYLEDKYPDPPLLPKDPQARAVARLIEEVCGTHYEAANWGMLEVKWSGRVTDDDLAGKLREAAKAQIAQIQAWLEAYLGDEEYFNGSSFGYADVVALPFVNWSAGDGNGPAEDSVLGRWLARVLKRPSCKETVEEYEAAAKHLSALKDAFKPGSGQRREYRDHRLEWMIKSGGLEIVERGIKEDTIRLS